MISTRSSASVASNTTTGRFTGLMESKSFLPSAKNSETAITSSGQREPERVTRALNELHRTPTVLEPYPPAREYTEQATTANAVRFFRLPGF